jgi:hypothetical protein
MISIFCWRIACHVCEFVSHRGNVRQERGHDHRRGIIGEVGRARTAELVAESFLHAMRIGPTDVQVERLVLACAEKRARFLRQIRRAAVVDLGLEIERIDRSRLDVFLADARRGEPVRLEDARDGLDALERAEMMRAVGVRKLLRQLGYSVQRPTTRLVQAKPRQKRKWVRETYPNPKKTRGAKAR